MNNKRNMKRLIVFLITATLISGGYGYANAQNNRIDDQAIKMLKEAYTAYSLVYISTDANSNKKFDLLVAKYCTPKFKKEAKEYHNNDYGTDILTDENGIGKDSPKSLKIVKDVKKANTYIVSYFTMVDSPSTSAETN